MRDPARSLRPALLRRSGRRWRSSVPARPVPRHSSLRPRATARRELRAAPLGTVLALRRPRLILRSSSFHSSRATQLLTALGAVTLRTARIVYLAATSSPELALPSGRVPHAARERAVAVPPLARPLVHTVLQRERIVRHRRAEAPQALAAAGPAGPSGPAGPAGPVSRLPMLLRVPAVPARAEPSAAAFLVGPPPGVELAPSLGAAPAHAPAPSVDELTSQVLDRIERRAIAQRERMGRI